MPPRRSPHSVNVLSRTSPYRAALLPRTEENVLHLLEGLALRLGHQEEHEDEAAGDDAGEHEEKPWVVIQYYRKFYGSDMDLGAGEFLSAGLGRAG